MIAPLCRDGRRVTPIAGFQYTFVVDEWGTFSAARETNMDLSYGPGYDTFRQEVHDFIEKYRAQAPRGEGLRSERVRNWQKLLEHGTEEQKRTFIPPTLSGEMIWCQGYSEPNAGSDLASLRTSAVLDGDEWVVNGSKIWTSTAHLADWMFCLVRTEPQAPKHRGISFLLIRMDAPGIEIGPLVDMTMARNFNEDFLTDVRVPKDQIVGKRGEGWPVANAVLGHERFSLGDPNASLMRLHRLLALMREETVDGLAPWTTRHSATG